MSNPSSIGPLAAALLLGGGCAGDTMPVRGPTASRPPLARVTIAPTSEALTFARVGRRVLAVTRYEDGRVEGVDLAADDPIALFRAEGYDVLRSRIDGAAASARVSVSAGDLGTPVDLRDHHVATGLNFPAHGGESGAGVQPFLFPKLTRPTGPRAPVAIAGRLLDYEVEVAWVPLAPLAEHERPASMGLVLSNDYTDRETLLRTVDPWNPGSGKGFTTGKSFAGSLPVGDLFVIPRDVRAFASGIELRLWVNDRLRQRAPLAASTWKLDDLVAQVWARRDLVWDDRGTEARLPVVGGRLPDRTLIMSGTPDGTIFRAIGTGQRLRGLGAWLLGGWHRPLPAHVIDAYIRDARDAGIYLQPGDRVAIHVERLGVIENEVTS
jgi:2-keto-4-pentenoate hydratase/2-oxohepta-3-ene-1,7-dioic acid hydratase in catechol pathway